MDSPSEAAAKQLAWDMETRKSVEVRVSYGIDNKKKDSLRSAAFDRVVEHYIETAAGQRFLEFRGKKGDLTTSRSVHFGDGVKFTDINYDPKNTESQQSVYVKQQFWMEEGSDRKQVPQPLLYEYVGREPLYKALRQADFLGKSEVIGRECNVFLFKQVRWAVPQDQVFHLDAATSIPLKVESFLDQASRENGKPLGVWTAQTLDKIQGRFVPLMSTLTSYAKDGAQQFNWNYNVESIAFDKDYPPSTFQSVFQSGVTVFDGIVGKATQTPGAKKAVPEAPKEAATTAQPVRAVPPSDWSAGAPGLALGIGFAVLIVAGLLWRRGR